MCSLIHCGRVFFWKFEFCEEIGSCFLHAIQTAQSVNRDRSKNMKSKPNTQQVQSAAQDV